MQRGECHCANDHVSIYSIRSETIFQVLTLSRPSPKYGTTVDPALSQEGQAGRVRAKIPVNYYIGNYSYDDDDDEDYNHDDNEDDDGDDGENIVVARSNETINEKFSQQSSDKLRGHDVNAGQFSARKRARDDHVDDPMQSHKKQQRQEKDLVSDLRARLSDNNTLLTQGLAPKGLVRRAAGWPMTGSQSDHIRALCRAITDHQAQCYDSMTSSAQSKDALLIFFNDQEKMKPSGKRYWMKDWSDSYMEALGRRVKEILPSSSTAPSTAPAPSNNQATMTSAYPTRILPSLSTVPSTVPSTAPTSSSNQATTPPEHSARVAGDLIPSSSGNTVTDSRRGPGLAGDNRRSQVAWACFYPQR